MNNTGLRILAEIRVYSLGADVFLTVGAPGGLEDYFMQSSLA